MAQASQYIIGQQIQQTELQTQHQLALAELTASQVRKMALRQQLGHLMGGAQQVVSVMQGNAYVCGVVVCLSVVGGGGCQTICERGRPDMGCASMRCVLCTL
jgi:hypothetical protein